MPEGNGWDADPYTVRVRDGWLLMIWQNAPVTIAWPAPSELAQLNYQSTRLVGEGVALSRLAGGIGTRGPGESKLEINRRRIRERMTELRRQSLKPIEDDTETAEENIINYEKTIAELQAKMIKAAENLEFEEAAALRDRIRKLEKEMSE